MKKYIIKIAFIIGLLTPGVIYAADALALPSFTPAEVQSLTNYPISDGAQTAQILQIPRLNAGIMHQSSDISQPTQTVQSSQAFSVPVIPDVLNTAISTTTATSTDLTIATTTSDIATSTQHIATTTEFDRCSKSYTCITAYAKTLTSAIGLKTQDYLWNGLDIMQITTPVAKCHYVKTLLKFTCDITYVISTQVVH